MECERRGALPSAVERGDAISDHRLQAPPLAYGYRQKWAAAHLLTQAPPLAHKVDIQKY